VRDASFFGTVDDIIISPDTAVSYAIVGVGGLPRRRHLLVLVVEDWPAEHLPLRAPACGDFPQFCGSDAENVDPAT
jgi:hypothetical protein